MRFVTESIIILTILLTSEAYLISRRLDAARSLKTYRHGDLGARRLTSSSRTLSLLYSYYGEEKSGFSLKVVFTLFFLSVGLYGGSISGIFKSAEESLINQQRSGKAATEESRGSMTHLTKREINEKLSAIPVFYIGPTGKDTIFINNEGEGFFFADKADAEQYASSSTSTSAGVDVKATTLDDVFYTLIEKKTKLGTQFLSGVSATADPAAKYRLKGSPAQMKNADIDWKESHPFDFPLFRVPTLAFNSEEGLKVPLFLLKEDAITSFDRLQEAAESKRSKRSELPELQVTSLQEVIERFQTGGFEGRALEFYPSMEAIQQARTLISNNRNE